MIPESELLFLLNREYELNNSIGPHFGKFANPCLTRIVPTEILFLKFSKYIDPVVTELGIFSNN